MKFKASTRRRAIEYEKALVEYWKQNKTFEKSVQQRPADDTYVFYDGPPFITGVPHHGTLLSSIIKDAVPRYWTMKGKRVERVWGWDSHGLPAENFVEKKLGITDRRDIGTKISLEEYITTARDSMVANSATWEDVIDRVGRWVDFKGAYKTMDKEYMESVWWAFKTLYEKGKIYEGYKVLMYDTKFATPVSKNEVTMDNDAYQTVTDPSVYVKFKLYNEPRNFQLTKDAKILFVCAANIGRSQAAMSLYNSYTKSRNSEGAGTEVEGNDYSGANTVRRFEELKGAKNGEVIAPTRQALIDSHDIDIVDNNRRQLTKEMLDEYDLVVNLASRNQTPDWFRGDNVVWWDIEDVGDSGSIEIARNNVREIDERVKRLINSDVVDDRIDVRHLLAWTTTPWTLPANTALAVNPELDYATVDLDGERFIVAKDLAEKTFTDEKHRPLDYKIIETFPGAKLIGLRYEPLNVGIGYGFAGYSQSKVHTVLAADFVSSDSGTGIVHIAPAYGEQDFELMQKEGLPGPLDVLDDNGYYTDGNWKGQNVWEINKQIAKDLKERGAVWKIEYIQHEYPFNPRSKQRIMYRAVPSWFYDIDGQKQELFAQNSEHINWFPEHLKHGRFEKNIEQAPDWNLSRDRFWASAMPVWEGTDKDGNPQRIVVGSYDELYELSGKRLDDYHRPWVDQIEFDKDGVHYKRIEKVLDGWFESGSMPFAQFHYPFENKEKFEANFPGDFISEYIGQVRAWFYYLHVVNVGLFGVAPFKNVITTGTLAGNDGRKMSKSLGNYTDPNELMDKFSADSLRFLLLSSPLLSGEDFSLQDKEVGDVARKLSMIWNMYDFFTMYAEVDGWEFDPEKSFTLYPDDLKNPLDKWIVSRLHELNTHVTKHMDDYNIPVAMSEFLPFIDDASNWFVRRSRRRFWRSSVTAAGADDDGDKAEAYRTLHYVLMKLAVILAPFTPFLSEELYQKMGGGNESVHLLDWPANDKVDQLVLDEMKTVREYVNQALSLRAQEKVKIRQPLANVTVPTLGQFVNFEDILTEELNVKKVIQGKELALDFTITPELKREGLMREVIRHVQAARKDSGLNVDDRIKLSLVTDDKELQKAIDEHSETIAAETLANSMTNEQYSYETTVSVEGAGLKLSLEKA